MYFPRLYPDELLYSGIARCRVHLGIGNHKTLLHMLFGDSKVAAITDLPTHLTALASNKGRRTCVGRFLFIESWHERTRRTVCRVLYSVRSKKT